MTVWGPTLVSGRPPPILAKLAELADWLIRFSSTMIGSIHYLAEDFLDFLTECKTFNLAASPSPPSSIHRKVGALLVSSTSHVDLSCPQRRSLSELALKGTDIRLRPIQFNETATILLISMEPIEPFHIGGFIVGFV